MAKLKCTILYLKGLFVVMYLEEYTLSVIETKLVLYLSLSGQAI